MTQAAKSKESFGSLMWGEFASGMSSGSTGDVRAVSASTLASFQTLPVNLTVEITQFLSLKDVAAVSKCSKEMRSRASLKLNTKSPAPALARRKVVHLFGFRNLHAWEWPDVMAALSTPQSVAFGYTRIDNERETKGVIDSVKCLVESSPLSLQELDLPFNAGLPTELVADISSRCQNLRVLELRVGSRDGPVPTLPELQPLMQLNHLTLHNARIPVDVLRACPNATSLQFDNLGLKLDYLEMFPKLQRLRLWGWGDDIPIARLPKAMRVLVFDNAIKVQLPAEAATFATIEEVTTRELIDGAERLKHVSFPNLRMLRAQLPFAIFQPLLSSAPNLEVIANATRPDEIILWLKALAAPAADGSFPLPRLRHFTYGYSKKPDAEAAALRLARPKLKLDQARLDT